VSTVLLTLTLTLVPLADTRPVVGEARRFPPHHELLRLYYCARDFVGELRAGKFGCTAVTQATLEEAQQLLDWFDNAVRAVDGGSDTNLRRDGLQRMLELDPDGFWQGRVPPCVPWWRLPRR